MRTISIYVAVAFLQCLPFGGHPGRAFVFRKSSGFEAAILAKGRFLGEPENSIYSYTDSYTRIVVQYIYIYMFLV